MKNVPEMPRSRGPKMGDVDEAVRERIMKLIGDVRLARLMKHKKPKVVEPAPEKTEPAESEDHGDVLAALEGMLTKKE